MACRRHWFMLTVSMRLRMVWIGISVTVGGFRFPHEKNGTLFFVKFDTLKNPNQVKLCFEQKKKTRNYIAASTYDLSLLCYHLATPIMGIKNSLTGDCERTVFDLAFRKVNKQKNTSPLTWLTDAYTCLHPASHVHETAFTTRRPSLHHLPRIKKNLLCSRWIFRLAQY